MIVSSQAEQHTVFANVLCVPPICSGVGLAVIHLHFTARKTGRCDFMMPPVNLQTAGSCEQYHREATMMEVSSQAFMIMSKGGSPLTSRCPPHRAVSRSEDGLKGIDIS